MPGRTTAGKRYAEAIAAIARQEQSWDAWRQDLVIAAGAFQEPQFALTFESPRVPIERKTRLIDEVLGGRVTPLAQNLLKVMSRRGRLGLVHDMIVWFNEIADRETGVRRYTVTTAAPLSGEQRQRLERQLAYGGGNAVIEEIVDPALIGGMVVRHGDIIQDFSIRARLEALRERLN